MTVQDKSASSPWRSLFEEVRRAAGNERDEHGVRGSINWLRQRMELRGANPNVVRNIIYRDKGRLEDKRVLFEILSELWREAGGGELRHPELEVLLSSKGEVESELVRLLGREKRRVYKEFVGGVRAGGYPKLVVTGRAGSGKTLLLDYVQEALEVPPRAAERLVRMEFGSGRLETALIRLAVSVGVPADVIETRLTKVGASGAFSVQADAQAEVARAILDAVRATATPLVLLGHVSRASGMNEHLGTVPIRLNTPEVPRVSAAEWLWLSLFAPLARLPGVAILVSMSELPARAVAALGDFSEPVRLNPPTINEARRFVRARLPHLDPKGQEEVVRRAGRSFEELRTLTLLSEARVPLQDAAGSEHERHGEQLAALVTGAGDERLRAFLAALAVLSLPEFPTISLPALHSVRGDPAPLSPLESSFLDAVPPDPDRFRPFSRQFARQIRAILEEADRPLYRQLSERAAGFYREEAERHPGSEEASRYLQHLFQARDWPRLTDWIQHAGEHQSLMPQMWNAAREELGSGPIFERVAYRVAWHYVRLGAYRHPQATSAFEALEASEDDELRTWALVQQAEGAVLRGQVDRAEELLAATGTVGEETFAAEIALVRASIARWRSELDRAAGLVTESASFPDGQEAARAGVAVTEKSAVWAGLIAKDRGDLQAALREFEAVESDDELIEARVAFQKGDVLMSLGRFDAALAELDRAVQLARENHALTPEQSRFLSRRGTLHRRRGELERAFEDFEAAAATVTAEGEGAGDLEREFWLARSEDERSLTLLARGDFTNALLNFERNIETFARYGDHLGVDASYRVWRGELYLARAYLFRALGMPFSLPLPPLPAQLPAGPDLEHARSLVGRVSGELERNDGERLYWALRRENLHLASLLANSAQDALEHTRLALNESTCAYQRAESHAHSAAAHLRRGDGKAAAEDVRNARSELEPLLGEGERGDLALRSWLASLEVEAAFREARGRDAAELLLRHLADSAFASYHEKLLRNFGEVAEGCESPELALAALANRIPERPPMQQARLRLPDALSGWWLQGGKDALQRAHAEGRLLAEGLQVA